MEENKIPTIEEMKKEAFNIARGIPNLREKQIFMTEIRGITIEFSIIVELCFNQLITSTGKELVFDHENKTFELIKGIRTKKNLPPKFKTKSDDIKKLIKKMFIEHGDLPEQTVFDNFDRFIAIRDIFAHVPVNWNATRLEFSSDALYDHFFKLDQKWRDILVAHSEFVGLFEWIVDVILAYNRNILLKKEFLSLVFLGKSQAEIRKEAEKNKIGH